MALTVATFNVKNLFVPPGPPNEPVSPTLFEARLSELAKWIHQADPDLLGLQEVGSHDAVQQLINKLPNHAQYGQPMVGPPDHRGICNALISRRPVVEHAFIARDALPFPKFYSGDPPPFGDRLALRRAMVQASIDDGGGSPVTVFVCHLKAGIPIPQNTDAGEKIPPVSIHGRAEGAVRALVLRTAEALFVRSLVDQVRVNDRDARILVMGDMNDQPHSLPLQILRGDVGGSLEFRDGAELIGCERVVAEGDRYSLIHRGTRKQLDHILATPNVFDRVEQARFHNQTLREHIFHPGAEPTVTVDSDHALFSVTFR